MTMDLSQYAYVEDKDVKVNKITDHFLPQTKRVKVYHENQYPHELRYLTPTPSNQKIATSILDILCVLADKMICELSTGELAPELFEHRCDGSSIRAVDRRGAFCFG